MKHTLVAGLVLLLLAGIAYFAVNAPDGKRAPAAPGTVLVTGSNRGIGLEFATQYAVKGWTVIATHRRDETPGTLADLQRRFPSVQPERMDITNHAEIDALAEKLRGTPIDVLINNAAIMGTGHPPSAQTFGTLNHTLFDRYMHTNALGPIKVAEAFFDHVAASNQKKIINISSSSGSLTDPRPHSNRIWYRASKTALNGLMMASVPAAKQAGVSITMFEPGWTWTGKNPAQRDPDQLDPAEVVAAMIDTIATIDLEDTGQFIRRHGDKQPW